MHKTFKLLSLSIAAAFIFASCSKSNNSVTNPDSDSYWKLGDYTYTRGGSSQDDQTTHGDFTSVAVSTVGDGGNYGDYSGSAVTYSFPSNLGPGKYAITSDVAMVSAPALQQMEITCTVGTAVNTGAVLYASDIKSEGTADVSIDKDGKYHITIDKPVVLAKGTEVSGGIDGAADHYSITVHNAY